MHPAFTLTPSTQRAFDRLTADCRRIFEARLVAIVATGQTSSVVFAEPISSGDLEALSALVETWARDGLMLPLLLAPSEFLRSLDTFPLEYQALMDHHVVVAGEPPFANAVVPAEQLRRACEVQAKGHLIHVRQGWIEAAGRDTALQQVLVQSAAPLRAVLTNIARLHRHDEPFVPHLASRGAHLAGLDASLVHEILALDETPERAAHLVRRLPEYLRACEALWSFVDRWSVA